MAIDNIAQAQLGPGRGEAVALDISAPLRAAQEYRRQNRGTNLAMAKIAAKQKADQEKAAKEELYKMTGQVAGDAGYLTPYTTDLYSRFNQNILNKLQKGEFVDENMARNELNSIKNLEAQGKTITDQIRARFPDLEQNNFINTPQFENAVRMNLDEAYKKHIAEGQPEYNFRPNVNEILGKSTKDTRFNVYNYDAAGKREKERLGTKTLGTVPRPGQESVVTSGSGLLQQRGGILQNKVDPVLYQQIISSPQHQQMIDFSFQQELSKDGSEYFIQDQINKQVPLTYEQNTQALRDRFANTKYAELAGLQAPNLNYSNIPSYTQAQRPPASSQKNRVESAGDSEVAIFSSPSKNKPGYQAYTVKVKNIYAPVSDAQVPMSVTFDANLKPVPQKSQAGAFTPMDDYLGITTIPFINGKLTGANGKEIPPNTAFDQNEIIATLGPGQITYTSKDGRTRVYENAKALVGSGAITMEPMYVFNAGVFLKKGDPKTRFIAKEMGVENDLDLTGKMYPVGTRYVKAKNAGALQSALMKAPNRPTIQELKAMLDESVNENTERLKRQFGGTIGGGASFLKPKSATTAKPLDNDFK